jgi:hypothetical protein
VGDERLPALLWRPAATRWPHGRPARTAPGVHGRRRPVRLVVAVVWTRLVARGADRRARRPGRLGRDHGPDRTLPPDDGLPGRPRPQQGARDLGRDRRSRRHSGPLDRRPGRFLARLGMGLLHQHPGRARCAAVDPAVVAGKRRHRLCALFRSRGSRNRHWSAAAARLHHCRGPPPAGRACRRSAFYWRRRLYWRSSV